MERTVREGCPAWCRGHFAVETGPSDQLSHDAGGVTVEPGVHRPPGEPRTSVWATAAPGAVADPTIIISRCVPPPELLWRVDLTRAQANQLAGLAEAFAPGLASALRETLRRVR
ncbi:hypothetical protein OG216_44200 [Streptomycetaceae bacterium NBC_01309]